MIFFTYDVTFFTQHPVLPLRRPAENRCRGRNFPRHGRNFPRRGRKFPRFGFSTASVGRFSHTLLCFASPSRAKGREEAGGWRGRDCGAAQCSQPSPRSLRLGFGLSLARRGMPCGPQQVRLRPEPCPAGHRQGNHNKRGCAVLKCHYAASRCLGLACRSGMRADGGRLRRCPRAHQREWRCGRPGAARRRAN